MPLNESTGPRFSNLTREQRRAAEAAIFGIKESDLLTPQLSNEEIDRMRQILTEHDAQHGRGLKTFDLNNPPKEPYRFQEYPRVMYHHKKRQTRTARSADEMQLACDAGWSKEPFPVEVSPDAELDPATQAEVALLDKEARKPKQKG